MKKILSLLLCLFSGPALADYAATQGAGTNFGSKVVTTVHYPQQTMCDPATPANCVAVSASGQITVLQGGAWTVNPTTAANWAIGANGAANPANSIQAGLSDGTNLQKWLAAIALGDAVNGNNTGAVVNWLYNGTTFDRARGDVTNGAWVNVKTSVLPTGGATSANQSSQLTQETAAATGIGAPADASCGTATGTCSLIALQKFNNTATGSAVPAGTNIIGKTGIDQTTDGTTNLAAMGAQAGATGATTRMIACDQTAIYDASTTGSTELVAISGTKVIYVCGYSIISGGTVNVKLITGTGVACATGSSNKTPAYQLTAQAGISDGSPFFRGLKTAAGGALCINASGAVAAQAIVYFAQF